jgi:hypothetical protein
MEAFFDVIQLGLPAARSSLAGRASRPLKTAIKKPLGSGFFKVIQLGLEYTNFH